MNFINYYIKLFFGYVQNKCNKVVDDFGYFVVYIEI